MFKANVFLVLLIFLISFAVSQNEKNTLSSTAELVTTISLLHSEIDYYNGCPCIDVPEQISSCDIYKEAAMANIIADYDATCGDDVTYPNCYTRN